jgi:hypothetical protein
MKKLDEEEMPLQAYGYPEEMSAVLLLLNRIIDNNEMCSDAIISLMNMNRASLDEVPSIRRGGFEILGVPGSDWLAEGILHDEILDFVKTMAGILIKLLLRPMTPHEALAFLQKHRW